MSHLAPCPACNRHVDVAETACPFCAAVLAPSFRAARPLGPPPRASGAGGLDDGGRGADGRGGVQRQRCHHQQRRRDRPPGRHERRQRRPRIRGLLRRSIPRHRRGGRHRWYERHRRRDGRRRLGWNDRTRRGRRDRSVVAIYGAAVPARWSCLSSARQDRYRHLGLAAERRVCRRSLVPPSVRVRVVDDATMVVERRGRAGDGCPCVVDVGL